MGQTPRAGVIPGPGEHSPLGYHVSGKRGRHTKAAYPPPASGHPQTSRKGVSPPNCKNAGPPIPPPAAGVTSPANRGTVARAKVAAGHWSTATVMVAGLLVVVDDGRTRRPAGRSGPQVQTALLHRDWQ